MDRYPALRIIAPALRYTAIVTAVAGSGVSVLYLLGAPTTEWSTIIVIAGIVLSVVFGVLLYVVGYFIGCFLDIEERMYSVEVNAKAGSASPVSNGARGDAKPVVKAKSKGDSDTEVKTLVKAKSNGNNDTDVKTVAKAKSNGNGHADGGAVKATRRLKVVEKA